MKRKYLFFVLDFRIESSRYKLAKLEMKDWVLILRREFDFHHRSGQPFPAVILLVNPVDGRYFVTVLAQVKQKRKNVGFKDTAGYQICISVI